MAGFTQELFDDEFTREVRDAYVRLRVHGVPAHEATEAVLYDHRYSALMSPAHAALLWIALAVTQWQTGETVELTRERAIRLAEDSSWVRLRAASSHDDQWRRTVLGSVRQDLASTPLVAPPIEIEPLYQTEPLDEARRMKIASSLAALRAGNTRLDFDAEPHVVVRDIARELDDARASLDTLSEARRTAIILSLGTLWGQQLVRLGAWEWAVVVDTRGSRSRALVRCDQAAFISPFLFASWYLDDPDANANVAEALFAALREERFPRARQSGVLLSLRDYSYRLSDRKWPEERAHLLNGITHPVSEPVNVLADLDASGGLDALSDTSSCTINAPIPTLHERDIPCPPAAGVVARRALVLRSVLDHTIAALPRDLLATFAAGWDAAERARYAPEAEALSRRRVQALRESGLWTHAEREEQAVLETPFTELHPPQLIAASWRAESLAMLLWALGRIDTIPPYDEVVNGELLLSLASSQSEGFVVGASLRPREEIERARTIAELWHWRSRTRQLSEAGRRFPGVPGLPVKSWEDVVRYTAPQAVTQGLLSHALDEDFPAFGRAYRDLSPEEWAQARSIAMERHFALNWLCGYAPGNQWSLTPTDT